MFGTANIGHKIMRKMQRSDKGRGSGSLLGRGREGTEVWLGNSGGEGNFLPVRGYASPPALKHQDRRGWDSNPRVQSTMD